MLAASDIKLALLAFLNIIKCLYLYRELKIVITMKKGDLFL